MNKQIFTFSCAAISFLIVFSFAAPLHAQTAPGIQWQKNYGGSGNEVINNMLQLPDSGYLLSAYSNSTNGEVTGNHGDFDYWIVRTDKNGNIIWQKSYGGSASDLVEGACIAIGGGYIINGVSYSADGDVGTSHGDADAWIIKIDDTGAIIWRKVIGGSGTDLLNPIVPTPDHGYISVGSTSSTDYGITSHGHFDLWIVKLDSVGNVLWQKSYGGSSYDYGATITPTYDNNFIVCGATLSSDGDITGFKGAEDCWLLKINDTGKVLWSKTYGGSSYDQALSAVQAADSGYVFCGYTLSNNGDVTGNHGGTDYWVVKTDDTGAIKWQKALGGTDYDMAYTIQNVDDSNYLVAGYAKSTNDDVTGNHGFTDAWVIKINDSGNMLWEKALGGSFFDTADYILQTFDGGYLISANSFSSNGDLDTTYGGGDAWVVKLKDVSSVMVQPVNAVNDNILVYPTLTSGVIHINMPAGYEHARITMISSIGQQLSLSGDNAGLIRTVRLQNGIEGTYFLNVVNNGKISTYKVVYRP